MVQVNPHSCRRVNDNILDVVLTYYVNMIRNINTSLGPVKSDHLMVSFEVKCEGFRKDGGNGFVFHCNKGNYDELYKLALLDLYSLVDNSIHDDINIVWLQWKNSCMTYKRC